MADRYYDIWHHIKQKCFNSKSIYYKNYGERGITMYEKWIENPNLFIDYIKSLENYNIEGYSLDRENNDGNYEPGNLRWTDYYIQNGNKRKYKNNKTGYSGIYIDYRTQKICAKISNKYLGTFKSIEEALLYRNNYILENDLNHIKLQ